MSPEAKKPTRSRAASTATKAAGAAKPAAAKPARTRAAGTKPAGDGENAAEPAARAKEPTNGAYRKPVYAGLRQRYHDEIVPAMQREFTYGNSMEIPRVEKIVVNIGLGEAIANAKALDAAVGDLTTITGQKPIVTRAKRSIAQFRLRTGMPIGAKVTLRGQRMYDFLERTLALALPRIRDFRGIPTRSFDGRGNFSLGLRERNYMKIISLAPEVL